MSLEEQTRWLKTFESYLAWNESVIETKSTKNLQDLLESYLDTGLISKLDTDQSVTKETTVLGSTGILVKLRVYFIDVHPHHQSNVQPQLIRGGAGDRSEEARHAANVLECPGCRMDATSTLTTTMTYYTWVFPVYLKHVAVIAQRIEASISLWRKDRGTGGDDKR